MPRVDPKKGKKLMNALSSAIDRGLVKACHDCSEGGIGVAAAEMAFASGLGMEISLKEIPLTEPMERDDFVLFSESNTRFLVEVAPNHKARFENMMTGVDFAGIGRVTNKQRLEVYGLTGKTVLSAPLTELKKAWQNPLHW